MVNIGKMSRYSTMLYTFKHLEQITYKNSFIYTRVGSVTKKDALDKQISTLQKNFPNHFIITDISSGYNFNRPGLIKLIELSNQKLVKEIVVTSHDRLSKTKIGYHLLDCEFKKNNVKIHVYIE